MSTNAIRKGFDRLKRAIWTSYRWSIFDWGDRQKHPAGGDWLRPVLLSHFVSSPCDDVSVVQTDPARHESGNSFAGTPDALRMEICVNSWAPVDTSIRLKRDVDLFGTFRIFSTMLAGFAVAPDGEATHRHFQRVTHDRDSVLLLVITKMN